MSGTANPAVVYVKNPNVHWTVLEGEAVLVNLENGFYYNLNRVGTAIWELLEEGRPLEDVLSGVCERFEVPREEAEQDLSDVVANLRQEQLVEQAPAREK